MPLYEYQCDNCRHRFEAIQKFSDPPLTSCPKCGAAVRKLQSAPAFQFKGDGWYITDYAKKDGGKKKEGEKADGGKAEGGGSAADTKSGDSKGSETSTSSSAGAAPSSTASSPPSATKTSS